MEVPGWLTQPTHEILRNLASPRFVRRRSDALDRYAHSRLVSRLRPKAHAEWNGHFNIDYNATFDDNFFGRGMVESMLYSLHRKPNHPANRRPDGERHRRGGIAAPPTWNTPVRNPRLADDLVWRVMMARALILLVGFLIQVVFAPTASTASTDDDAPRVTHVAMAAPGILGITLEAGRVEPSRLGPYVPEPGDELRTGQGIEDNVLVRLGKWIGWVIGPDKDTLVTVERVVGRQVPEKLLGERASWTIESADDAAYARRLAPNSVYRKSKPIDWAQPAKIFAMRHIVYLQLPSPPRAGASYVVRPTGLGIEPISWRFEPDRQRSEAVHASQIGYRSDDPVKRAYVSLWMGTGGSAVFPEPMPFAAIDDATGKMAFQGNAELAWAARKPEHMHQERNYVMADVWRLDFSSLKTSGRYRVCVAGLGCSWPFEIGNNSWQHAFLVQMRGLFNQRSGIELGPPWTPFRKPRDFHPADGAQVIRTRRSLLDGGTEREELDTRGRLLPAAATGELVADAWGGYHDAGDWNPRRVTHLKVTMALLEVVDLFPAFFNALDLRIPAVHKGIPPVLDEALWGIDVFRRLQRADGGVPWGIETNGDPGGGEVSWRQSEMAYVYDVDPFSSWVYAAAAARAARLLSPADKALGEGYGTSAVKAMEWAEADYARRKANGTDSKMDWTMRDARNLASAELLHLTGNRRWHAVFLETTCLKDPGAPLFKWNSHDQAEAAFAYARLPDSLADPRLKANAVRGMEEQARLSIAYAAGNAFGLTTPNRTRPLFQGFYSTPDASELVRAHALTGKPEYLAGALQATHFALGCNPANTTYTSGLGQNPPVHPLKRDARLTGQAAPEGLTVNGNCDFIEWKYNNFLTWPIRNFLSKSCTPSAWDWPVPEAFFDIYAYPAQDEFVVERWWRNVLVWGYLAARP